MKGAKTEQGRARGRRRWCAAVAGALALSALACAGLNNQRQPAAQHDHMPRPEAVSPEEEAAEEERIEQQRLAQEEADRQQTEALTGELAGEGTAAGGDGGGGEVAVLAAEPVETAVFCPHDPRAFEVAEDVQARLSQICLAESCTLEVKARCVRHSGFARRAETLRAQLDPGAPPAGAAALVDAHVDRFVAPLALDLQSLWLEERSGVVPEGEMALAMALLEMETRGLAAQARQKLKAAIKAEKKEAVRKILVEQYILVTELHELLFSPTRRSPRAFAEATRDKLREIKRLGIRLEFVP